jgi:hypothetical protein
MPAQRDQRPRRRPGVVRRGLQLVRRVLVRAIGLIPYPLLLKARRLGRDALDASTGGQASGVVALSYGGTRFNLYVGAHPPWAQDVYSRWAQGTEVYELVMLECLTRVLRNTERPAFMDVGAFTGEYACYAAALLGDREDTYAVETEIGLFAGLLPWVSRADLRAHTTKHQVLRAR